MTDPGAAKAARDLIALAGPDLVHITSAANVETIKARGLVSAHALCVGAGVNPDRIALRRDRRVVGTAVLGHQRPILNGLRAANHVIDGYNAHGWAMQLDKRVFFWPAAQGARFGRALGQGGSVARLVFDTAQLASALAPLIDLSPINSGNFTQGGAHARRGDWLYVPLTAGCAAFRENRRVRGRDALREVSLRGSVPPDLVQSALRAVELCP